MDPQVPGGPDDPSGSWPAPSARSSPWSPPDAGASPDAPAAPRGSHDPGATGDRVVVEPDAPDGPPVPPPERRRRRRRRRLIGLAVVVVLGVPLGLAVAGILAERGDLAATDDAPAATDDPEDDGDDGRSRDGGTEGDDSGSVEDLDLESLTGADAVFGALLTDIARSEAVMVGFQDAVVELLAEPAQSPDDLLAALRETAGTAHDDLLDARTAFDTRPDDAGAELVRDRYVAHVDAWVDYLDAVADDPTVLGGDGAGYTVAINATADAFARALEAELPDDADAEVRDFADQLLDEGFRNRADAQV